MYNNCLPNTGSTNVQHNLEQKHYVTGYEYPGSYVAYITYLASLKHVIALIENSIDCKQHIEIECFNAEFKYAYKNPHHWWKNRNGSVMYNWGSPTGTYGCDCSTRNGTVCRARAHIIPGHDSLYRVDLFVFVFVSFFFVFSFPRFYFFVAAGP